MNALSVSLTAGLGALTAKWVAPIGVSGYEIYWRVKGSSLWSNTVPLEGTATTYEITKLTSDTTYEVEVVARIAESISGTAELATKQPPLASIQTKLSADKTSVEIVALPEGTTSIEVALMATTAGTGITYTSIPATQKVYVPPGATPVVDMIALKANQAFGSWAGRLQTIPATVTPIPPTVPAQTLVGIDCGKWTTPAVTDLHGVVDFVRLDTPGSISAFTSAGLKVINDWSGPYSTSGVASINPGSWSEKVVAWVKENPQCWAIEVLDEPAGTWFWGPNAASLKNAEAYAVLVRTVSEKLTAAFGKNRPLVLASYDGGLTDTSWGKMWYKLLNPTWVDGLTVHPYGGAKEAERAKSALGNRANVEAAYAQTKKPIYVTEIGWPTAMHEPPTGDSLQWNETEAADNLYNFITWTKAQPSVAAVADFCFRDYGTNAWYGVETATGVKKPSFTALQKAAHNLPL